MGYGRIVKLTTQTATGSDAVMYIVAEQDPAKAESIVRAKAPIGATVEAVGRASEHLLAALGLAPGEFKRA